MPEVARSRNETAKAATDEGKRRRCEDTCIFRWRR